MTPADARRILHGIEQERVDMMKVDRSAWTARDFDAHHENAAFRGRGTGQEGLGGSRSLPVRPIARKLRGIFRASLRKLRNSGVFQYQLQALATTCNVGENTIDSGNSLGFRGLGA
jgi:hypothetical protein